MSPNSEGPMSPIQRNLRVIEESRADTRLDPSQNNKKEHGAYAYEYEIDYLYVVY